ncbi:amidase [Pseudochrobactrum algeriensis]|uniref:amidase n=1 Tax=Pseudochrobactrum algeriensis TaxID=2834768 RepID=UPI001BCBE510|nr:amidase [Pseudochrobactrum algeriensis]QVQ36289.1 amidase [Pseudochrobactrum algeriensis]QVQ39506.1 amidase [Pseudochrobactrum algeriensis]QVQ43426.1 amidase [Pseudochrobactrum algeriensis]
MAAPEFNYTDSDATSLAQAIKDKVLSPREAVDEAFAAIARVNPQLNAIICEMRDAADEQLQHLATQSPQDHGALFGVPTLLKDDCPSYAGAPMSYGCRAADGNVSERDHELVTRYRAAGLVIIGKTNLPEFSCNIATEPSLHGATLNPWDVRKSIGGSSGGAAAAVAARMVPVAYGNDGAGSIRVPAACSGLFGLRPSRGRVPCGPVSTENWGGLVSHHVLTRSVRDSALMLDLTDAPEQGALYCAPAKTGTFMQAVNQSPRKLRIGLWQKTGLETLVEQAVLEGLQKTADMCVALGHEIVEIMPDYDAQALSAAFTKLVATYTAMEVDDLARDFNKPMNSDFFEPSNLGLAEYGRSLSGLDILRARNQANTTARSFGRMFNTVDVVLSPVLPCLPFDKGTLNVRTNDWKHFARQFMELTMFTHPVNAAGAPAMSIPLLQTAENTPLGMQFIAANGKEETLLTLAAQLERAYPWDSRRPAICA